MSTIAAEIVDLFAHDGKQCVLATVLADGVPKIDVIDLLTTANGVVSGGAIKGATATGAATANGHFYFVVAHNQPVYEHLTEHSFATLSYMPQLNDQNAQNKAQQTANIVSGSPANRAASVAITAQNLSVERILSLPNIRVTLSGELIDAGQASLDTLLQQSPTLLKRFPNRLARRKASVFELAQPSGELSWQLGKKEYTLPFSYDPSSKEERTYVVGDNCIGCGRCATVCPAQCIVFEDRKAFITQDLCLACGSCQKACPYNVIEAHVQ